MSKRQRVATQTTDNKTAVNADKNRLIFYFCEKYVKKSSKKDKDIEKREDKRYIRGSKITLLSRQKLIINEGITLKLNKQRLSTFQILKQNANYLQEQQIQKIRFKRNSLQNAKAETQIRSREFPQPSKRSFFQRYRHIKSLTKREEGLVHREDQPSSIGLRKRSTMVNFKPQFIRYDKTQGSKGKILTEPSQHLIHKSNCVSVARRYFGGKMQIKNTQSIFKAREKQKVMKIQNINKTVTSSTISIS